MRKKKQEESALTKVKILFSRTVLKKSWMMICYMGRCHQVPE